MKWWLQVFFCCICFAKQSSSSGIYFKIRQLESIPLTNPEPLSGVHSQMECILKCRQSLSKKKNAFYMKKDGKCFCVSDEVSENGIGFGELTGNLISEVCIFLKLCLY